MKKSETSIDSTVHMYPANGKRGRSEFLGGSVGVWGGLQYIHTHTDMALGYRYVERDLHMVHGEGVVDFSLLFAFGGGNPTTQPN